MLAEVFGRAIAMAPKFGAAMIAVEVGPGKLRARDLKRALNTGSQPPGGDAEPASGHRGVEHYAGRDTGLTGRP